EVPTRWQIRRGQQLVHDDGRLHCEVNLPYGDAVLGVAGSRTIMLAGSAAGLRDESGDTAARVAEAMAGDSIAALRQLRGPCVVLYVDHALGTLVFATDRVATRSPCYAIDADRICLGLTATDVEAVRTQATGLRPQALYDYVYFHVIPAPQTIFAG